MTFGDERHATSRWNALHRAARFAWSALLRPVLFHARRHPPALSFGHEFSAAFDNARPGTPLQRFQIAYGSVEFLQPDAKLTN
jgi:hypothetical protein